MAHCISYKWYKTGVKAPGLAARFAQKPVESYLFTRSY